MKKSYIWTLPTRIFHWMLVFYIVIMFITSEEESWLTWHAAFGYAIGILLLFRILWGFMGPLYSRFSDFPLSKEALVSFILTIRHPKKEYAGHNPAASWVMIGMVTTLIFISISGVLTYGVQEGRGLFSFLNTPWFKEMELFAEMHEFFFYFLLLLVVMHLGGILSDRLLHLDIKTVNKELGDAIIAEGAKYGIYPFVIALKDVATLDEAFLFPMTLNLHQHGVLENYRNDPRMIESSHIRAMDMNLKLVYFGEYNTLNPLTKHFIRIFGTELEYKLSPEKYSDGWFLTILHPEGDKAHALTKVMEYLERDTKDVTVFGDSVNDIGMFKLAGTSVAVSNALDEVKAVADVVLPHSNDEDGVARYLEGIS